MRTRNGAARHTWSALGAGTSRTSTSTYRVTPAWAANDTGSRRPANDVTAPTPAGKPSRPTRPTSASGGMPVREVSGAGAELLNPKVRNVLGQVYPGSVEAREVGDERGVQVGDPGTQWPELRGGPFPA